MLLPKGEEQWFDFLTWAATDATLRDQINADPFIDWGGLLCGQVEATELDVRQVTYMDKRKVAQLYAAYPSRNIGQVDLLYSSLQWMHALHALRSISVCLSGLEFTPHVVPIFLNTSAFSFRVISSQLRNLHACRAFFSFSACLSKTSAKRMQL